MTSHVEKNAASDAASFFEEVCSRHGWTIEELARHSGYELRTLQKTMKENGGVRFSDLMRRKIENASALASGRPVTTEPPGSYGSRSMPTSNSETVELLRSLLDDYEAATTDFKRKWLADQIVCLSGSLRDGDPGKATHLR